MGQLKHKITGQKFGKRTALNFVAGTGRWLCRCDCGNESLVDGSHLVAGRNLECAGCSVKRRRLRHGHSLSSGQSKTYRTWKAMKTRCYNKSSIDYPNYGAKGITICERWMHFDNFLADMGPRPDGTSIDRINNNGNYEPSNCRWATRKEQQRNTSCNRIVVFNNVEMAASAAAEKMGVGSGRLYFWLKVNQYPKVDLAILPKIRRRPRLKVLEAQWNH